MLTPKFEHFTATVVRMLDSEPVTRQSCPSVMTVFYVIALYCMTNQKQSVKSAFFFYIVLWLETLNSSASVKMPEQSLWLRQCLWNCVEMTGVGFYIT